MFLNCCSAVFGWSAAGFAVVYCAGPPFIPPANEKIAATSVRNIDEYLGFFMPTSRRAELTVSMGSSVTWAIYGFASSSSSTLSTSFWLAPVDSAENVRTPFGYGNGLQYYFPLA